MSPRPKVADTISVQQARSWTDIQTPDKYTVVLQSDHSYGDARFLE